MTLVHIGVRGIASVRSDFLLEDQRVAGLKFSEVAEERCFDRAFGQATLRAAPGVEMEMGAVEQPDFVVVGE